MATPGTITSLRGETDQYIHFRDNDALTYTAPDYIFNSEEDESSNDDFDGILQATLDTYTDADFWTTGGKVLTYNPITDQFDIVQGEYIF